MQLLIADFVEGHKQIVWVKIEHFKFSKSVANLLN